MKLEVTAKLVVSTEKKTAGVDHIAVKIRFVPKGSGHRGKSRRLAEAMEKSGVVFDVVSRTSGIDCKVAGEVEAVLAAVAFLQVPTMRVAS
jgi:hypothetical protein